MTLKHETMKTLSNEKCWIELSDKNEVYGRDLQDRYNEPSCYNKTVRSIKRAWAALNLAFNENTRMWDAMDILEANGIRMHSYCAVD
jgi:hypothetical protein